MPLKGVLAATGHRPNKLGGYSETAAYDLRRLARQIITERNPPAVISGMALGWDTAWASAAVDLGIPFVAAVPFAGQESAWPRQSQLIYQTLLARAAKIVIVCGGEYASYKMQIRNEWMVDHADEVVALWDGSSGGTANCVKYAKKVGRQIYNAWPLWQTIKT